MLRVSLTGASRAAREFDRPVGPNAQPPVRLIPSSASRGGTNLVAGRANTEVGLASVFRTGMVSPDRPAPGIGMDGRSRVRVLIASVSLVTGIWVLAWVLPLWLLPNWEARNQFGGMFGSVASLFSGLALIGLVYTIYMQHQQLVRSQEELAQTRRDLVRQAELQAISSLIALESARLSNSPSGGRGHAEARERLQDLEAQLRQLRGVMRGESEGEGVSSPAA